MLTLLTPETPEFETLRALNNQHAMELSYADPARFAHLLRHAFFAGAINQAEAFIIAFDQDASYDSPNFLWFKERFPRLVYIDRVLTAPAARGRGHGAALYNALFEKARAAGHSLAACEVNEDPPNPASDAFHARLGFAETGSATLPGGAKKVRYFTLSL